MNGLLRNYEQHWPRYFSIKAAGDITKACGKIVDCRIKSFEYGDHSHINLNKRGQADNTATTPNVYSESPSVATDK